MASKTSSSATSFVICYGVQPGHLRDSSRSCTRLAESAYSCRPTPLSAADIIRLYGLRFKIEHTFKQAVHSIGTFAYHFWMKEMKPLRRRKGDQHLHRETQKFVTP